MSSPFSVGDRVRWTSQSRGVETTKEGTVVAVVPAGAWTSSHRDARETAARLRDLGVDPDKYVTSRLGGGFPRDEESYLVAVPPDSDHPQAKPRLYWPRVAKLERAPARGSGPR